MIPYGRQDITQDDIDAVVGVLKSNFLTQGPKVELFEQSICEKVNVTHAVAVNSATSALHIACLALGVGQGDVVWTTPITFVASANCALYCGADVDFVDIDKDTYNLCAQELQKKLEHVKRNHLRLPKVVIPVHLCGQACEMDKIHELSQEYGFAIIEDASHSIGGSHKNQRIGACVYSDITVFSFHPVKIITTAEGGIATTNSQTLAKKMKSLSSHGITRNQSDMTEVSHGGWYYQQTDLGFNYRMTEMQAALGISQLSRLDTFVARRHYLAGRYNDLLSGLPVVLPRQRKDTYSAYHLYIIRLELDKIDKPHKVVFEALRTAGIGVNLHYIPVHMQPYYRGLTDQVLTFPEAENYYNEAISIPLYPGMTDEDQDQVVAALTGVVMP